jgi:hypothetical protein
MLELLVAALAALLITLGLTGLLLSVWLPFGRLGRSLVVCSFGRIRCRRGRRPSPLCACCAALTLWLDRLAVAAAAAATAATAAAATTATAGSALTLPAVAVLEATSRGG